MASDKKKGVTFCETMNLVCETMKEEYFDTPDKGDGKALFVVAFDTNDEELTCDFLSVQLGNGFDLSYALMRAMKSKQVMELLEKANEFKKTMAIIEQRDRPNKIGLN